MALMSTRERKATTLEDVSIFDVVKLWSHNDYKINLENKEWAELNWKDVETISFLVLIRSLLQIDGVVNEEERNEKATSLINYVKEHVKESSTDSNPEEELDLSISPFIPHGLSSSPFNTEYKGNATKGFEQYINKCYIEWTTNKKKWHSPYTAIVQSSGYGKTHLCKEFACTQTDWQTVYLCYRKEGVSGYPTGNRQARNFVKGMAISTFQNANEAIKYMIDWFQAWKLIRIAFYCQFHDNPSADYETCLEGLKNYVDGDSQKNQEQHVSDIFNKMNSFCNDGTNTGDVVLDAEERVMFWKLCEDHNTAETLHKHVERIFRKSKEFAKFKIPVALDKPILFVFDEARFLLEANIKSVDNYTMFRVVRGALKELTRNFFAVFVDTTSQVGNFLPPSKTDPSERYLLTDTGTEKQKLFHPYNQITTMDVLNVDSKGIHESHHVFLCGRPLWTTTFDSFSNVDIDLKLKELKAFAEKKLKCGKEENNEIVAIASMAVATDMSISPISTIVEKLVGSHMATCLVIEADRKTMLVSYPVEPILSEVVLSLLKKYNKKETLDKNILQHLISHLRIGTLNPGFTGELVVKLLFLLARGRASKPFKRCTLKDFLAALIVGQFPWPASYEIDTTKFQLSFTCFTKVMRRKIPFNKLWMHEDPQTVLQAFYDRNAALEFPTNQPGADLLLPVKCVDNGNEFKYILVQVKNVATTSSLIRHVDLDPKKVFGNQSEWCKYALKFSLLINVGWVMPDEDTKRVDFHERKNVVEIKGLDVYVKLTEETKDSLKKILLDYSMENIDNENDSFILTCRKLCDAVCNEKSG